MSSIKTTVFDGGTAIDFGNGVTATVHTPAVGTIALTLLTPVLHPVPTHTYQPAQPVADPDHVTIEMLPNKWSDVFAFYIECRKALAGATKSAEPTINQETGLPEGITISSKGVHAAYEGAQTISYYKTYNGLPIEARVWMINGKVTVEADQKAWSPKLIQIITEDAKLKFEPPAPAKVKRQRKVKETTTAKPAPQVRNRDWWDAWEPRVPNQCKSLAKAKTLDDFAKFRDVIQVEFTAGYKNVTCLTAPKTLHRPRFESEDARLDAIKNLVATHREEFSADLVKESKKALIALEDARWQARYMAQCGEPIHWQHGKFPETPSYLTSTSKGMYMGVRIKDAPSHKGLDAIPA